MKWIEIVNKSHELPQIDADAQAVHPHAPVF
jgi:hypothetical protein